LKIIFVLYLIFAFQITGESISTNLSDPKHREIYHEVTSKIRCICLPSLPIKSCSFNNCEVSALLKNFMENQIKNGLTAEEIIQKMQTGFGQEVVNDEVVQRFLRTGNEGMANGIFYGFGEKILAEPNSLWINTTLYILGIFGLGVIFFYFKRNSITKEVLENKNLNYNKYLKELE
jgi:cytochrome c-type biogenesis protein CcmH/NrfF